MIVRLLPVAAIAIALAGAIDPALTLSRPTRQRLAIMSVPAASLRLPSVNGTRADLAAAIRDRLASRLARDFEIQHAAAPSSAAIVLIGDRAPDALEVRHDVSVWAVDVAGTLSPNVSVEDVAASETHLSERTRVTARIAASGMRGRTSTIRLMQGALSLDERTHTWTSDREWFQAVLETAPTRAGIEVLRVEVVADRLEQTAIDNVRAAAVRAADRRARVWFYDARPSWSTAFMRRAIQDDPAFHVEFLTRVSREVSVRAMQAAASDALAPRALDNANAALAGFDVVILGAPDVLTRAEVSVLDRFARAGGVVLLVPDRTVEGPVLELLDGFSFRERLLDAPESLVMRIGGTAPRASELLAARTQPPMSTTIASAAASVLTGVEGRVLSSVEGPPAGDPVIVKSPRGRGYVYFNGALDAWRHRNEPPRVYERFAADLIRQAAVDAVPPLDVISPAVTEIGAAVEVVVRVRDASDGSARAAAQLVSPGGSTSPLRLWPASEPGTFVAALGPPAAGTYSIRAASGDATAEAQVAVRAEQDVDPDRPDLLRAFVSAHGGAVVQPDQIDNLAAELRAKLPARREARPIHPMRSPWWMLPFAGCLCGEWWWRRRRGLR